MNLKSVKNNMNEDQNSLSEAREIIIRMHDVSDYELLDDLLYNYILNHRCLDYISDLRFGTPAYVCIVLKASSIYISNLSHNAGVSNNIENGGLNQNWFNGVYKEIFDIKKDYYLIEKMLENREIYEIPTDFNKIYKNKYNLVYENKLKRFKNFKL